MNSYTFEVTEDHRLRFTLETDDRIDVYTSTEDINFGRASRVVHASIDTQSKGRTVTFKTGVDRESMEQLGATIYVPSGRADQ